MDQSNPDQVVNAVTSSIASAAVATANDSSEESPPPYLKLIVDCWEHIFDYLALVDIHSMGQTCKRMHQLVGYYFREYCPDLLSVLRERQIRISDHRIQLTPDFYKFISDLLIRDQLDYSLDARTFASLKTLAFNASQITEQQINYCQNVLKDVENLLLHDCTTDAGDIFRLLASHCSKLKYLDLKNCHEPNAVFNKMFLHHYPTLERMKYETFTWNEAQQVDELKEFLEKHTNLKQFECDDRFLWANRYLLNQTNVQLDRLSVYLKTPKIAMEFDQFVDVLRQLYQRGFYKILHFSIDLYYDYDNYEHLISSISTLPTLEALNIDVLDLFDNLSPLTNLTELRIGQPSNFSTELEMEITIKNLTKLQHLTIDNATIKNILPFIRHSKTLKTIKILDLRNTRELNLFVLNMERKRLENAHPVILYVRECVYLQEKWQSKNLALNYVKIERFVAFKAFLR